MCRDRTICHLLWWKILRSSGGFHYFYSCLSPFKVILVVLTLQYLNKQFSLWKICRILCGRQLLVFQINLCMRASARRSNQTKSETLLQISDFPRPPWQNWARLVARGVRGWSHSICIKCTLSACPDLVAVRPEDRSEEGCSGEKLQKEMSQSMLGWWTYLCFCLGSLLRFRKEKVFFVHLKNIFIFDDFLLNSSVNFF